VTTLQRRSTAGIIGYVSSAYLRIRLPTKTVRRSAALTTYEGRPIAELWIILAVIDCILNLVPPDHGLTIYSLYGDLILLIQAREIGLKQYSTEITPEATLFWSCDYSEVKRCTSCRRRYVKNCDASENIDVMSCIFE